MDPQEVTTELEQPEPNEDKVEGKEPKSAEASSPTDGSTGDTEHGSQTRGASHKNPPLQNGTIIETLVMACFDKYTLYRLQ